MTDPSTLADIAPILKAILNLVLMILKAISELMAGSSPKQPPK
jgi:hypothetical protein